MRQLIQNYRSGEMTICESPAPQLRAEGILVRTAYSLISAGTERSMVELARKSLLQKARSRPDLVRKVAEKAHTEGLLSAYKKAMLRLSTDATLGYSSCGTVIAVGSKIRDLKIGERVACGGIGYASHSEIAYVPRNLCVPVPDGIDLRQAAFTTLGAIALQGVRSAEVGLGEVVAVVGLGLVGLLTVQILKSCGCRVVGIDPDGRRCSMAIEMGADGAGSDTREQSEACKRISGGIGADAVLITAATTTSGPLETAGILARDRARIVVVGQVGMSVPRKLFYEKELSLQMSRSYGPGRYDRLYEEKGIDYPSGYVRWTENRNMAAVVSLIAERKLDFKSLTTHEVPFDQALQAYEMIMTGSEPYLGVLLAYSYSGVLGEHDEVVQLCDQRSAGKASKIAVQGQLGISLIGSGTFSTGVILPALTRQQGIVLRGVCSQGGLTARSVGDRWKFDYCTADPQSVFRDDRTDCVVICTRPDSHAELVCSALEAGKHVFVEKPLAVSFEQLDRIRRSAEANSSKVLMVGFNRRFSPFIRDVRNFIEPRSSPLMAIYRVNAGYLPPGDWQHDVEQGAGRIIGETGHFVDTLCYLTGSMPSEVFACAISSESAELCGFENANLNIRFVDGSTGVVVYTTHGSSAFSKERLEVFVDGSVAVIDDFRHLELIGKGKQRRRKSWLGQDKGHAAEIAAFLNAVRTGTQVVDSEEHFQVTACTLLAVESLRAGESRTVTSMRQSDAVSVMSELLD